MPDGSMDIAKVGNDPELYSVTFATLERSAGRRAARTFTRPQEIEEFLQRAGIRVVPADPELHDLGLLTSSGTAAQADPPQGGSG